MAKSRPSRLSEPELRQAASRPPALEDVLLSASVLLAPLGWALHFAVNYGLVYPAERWQSKAALHWVALAAALACLGSIALGWRGLRRSHLGPMLDNTQRERTRFLATCGCLAGCFFLLAVVAQSVPAVMLPLRGHP
jgi:hypothetical protein